MSCGNCVNCANKCDVCINCDTGDYRGCNTQQTFCTGSKMSGQLASAYIGAANAPSMSRNDIIIKKLPQATLNALIAYLNRAAAYTGERPSQDLSSSWPIAPESRPFVYADKIAEIISSMTSMNGGNNPGFKPSRDDIIYGSQIQALMDKINNLKLHTGACESCISSCNVTCDTCNTCNVCISCNTCQGKSSYSSHYSSHYSSSN